MHNCCAHGYPRSVRLSTSESLPGFTSQRQPPQFSMNKDFRVNNRHGAQSGPSAMRSPAPVGSFVAQPACILSKYETMSIVVTK